MSKKNCSNIIIFFGFFSLVISGLVQANDFIPYAGKREASLVNVEAADRIVVTFNTDATGFTRTISVKLPGLVVAQDTPRSDECERAAAAKALSFTNEFLNEARKIYVQDVRMHDSADDEGVGQILTDKSSLSSTLIDEGLARSDQIDPEKSWCI